MILVSQCHREYYNRGHTLSLTTIRNLADDKPFIPQSGCITWTIETDNNILKILGMQTLTDKQLHELAKKRVEFRTHLVVYLVVNSFLWIIWYFTGQGYMWPIWPMAGWGIGLVFHYIFDYRTSKYFSEEDEYRKLKDQFGEQKHVHQ